MAKTANFFVRMDPAVKAAFLRHCEDGGLKLRKELEKALLHWLKSRKR